MSNILSEISLHNTIYKIKDDNAATKEYVDAALQNVGNTSVVIQNKEPEDKSVIWIDPDDDTAEEFSPTINVTEITGGHTVEVTDRYGSQSFNVMDGAVGPQGPQGIQGIQGEQGPAGKDAPVPTHVTRTGEITNLVVADYTEYSLTDIKALVMNVGSAEAHGFVTFIQTGMIDKINIYGYVNTAGDDINSATNGQVWEFSCYNGFIIWKNWSA